MNIFFVSLGCDKNLVDSEMMVTELKDADYSITDDPEQADIIVINTCCFINDAKEESINEILQMAEYKKKRCRMLVAAGCLAQRYHEEITRDLPEVDVIVGTMAYDQLVDAIEEKMLEEGPEKFPELSGNAGSEVNSSAENHAVEVLSDINRMPVPLTKRENSSGGFRAYLKIAEGCDKCCTYCIIPKVRGRYRSVPMENLLSQAENLARSGVKELILVAQETTLYGADLYGKKSLHVLLRKLSEIDGIRWIRLLYCYPEEIYDELIDEIADNPKVCHYIDMPVQHASDRILKRMNRRTDNQELLSVTEKLRERIPDIAIRTTLITGFPGETEEDFSVLKDFVRSVKFDRLGVFTYSQEEGTPAALFPDQIDEEVKEERRNEIMELQQDIAFEHSEAQIGRVLDIIIEGSIPDEGVYVGRSYMDAPDVDGLVFVNYEGELESGDIVKAEILKAEGYDLIAGVLPENQNLI